MRARPKEVQDYLEKNVDPYFVPLLEKLVNEKPDDVASYCIAFFTEKQGGPAPWRLRSRRSPRRDSTSAAAAASAFDVAGMVASAASGARPELRATGAPSTSCG